MKIVIAISLSLMTQFTFAADGEDDSVYVEYLGEDAQFISELLTSYNVIPEGRRLRQQGTFECKLQYPKIKDSTTCEQIIYDLPIN